MTQDVYVLAPHPQQLHKPQRNQRREVTYNELKLEADGYIIAVYVKSRNSLATCSRNASLYKKLKAS